MEKSTVKKLVAGVAIVAAAFGAYSLGVASGEDGADAVQVVNSGGQSEAKDRQSKPDGGSSKEAEQRIRETERQTKETEDRIQEKLEERNKAIDADPEVGTRKKGTLQVAAPKFPTGSTNSDKPADFQN